VNKFDSQTALLLMAYPYQDYGSSRKNIKKFTVYRLRG